MRPLLPFPTSLHFALQGLVWAHRTQRNFRIQLRAGLVVGLACALLPISPWEIALVALCVTGVLCAELLNTAVEAAVDLASPRFHPLAKVAKDVAAGAVVVACLGALVAGVAIFLPWIHPLTIRPGGWAWAVSLAVGWGAVGYALPRLIGTPPDLATLPPRPMEATPAPEPPEDHWESTGDPPGQSMGQR